MANAIGEALEIRVLIGGTIRRPRLTLESDAQPPISQSDLLSYLAFGQSTTSLLSLEGSGLTGATSTGNLVGVGAALAMKRMAAGLRPSGGTNKGTIVPGRGPRSSRGMRRKSGS